MTEGALSVADSHCHIDMPAFDADRDAVMARARAAGVEAMLLIGGIDEEQGHLRALRVAGELGLPVSAGVHPHEARLATAAVYDELRAPRGATSGSWPSARSASTSTTTTRPATCSGRPSAPRCAWPAR